MVGARCSFRYRIGIVATRMAIRAVQAVVRAPRSLVQLAVCCFLRDTLSRDSILDAIRKRHHYATTGGEHGRPLITLDVEFPDGGTKFHDDPRHGRDRGILAKNAVMGDIVHLPSGKMSIKVDIRASVPIERVDIFNGLDLVETIRPYRRKILVRVFVLYGKGLNIVAVFGRLFGMGRHFCQTMKSCLPMLSIFLIRISC